MRLWAPRVWKDPALPFLLGCPLSVCFSRTQGMLGTQGQSLTLEGDFCECPRSPTVTW